MNRRDALKSLLALSGSTLVFGADRFLTGSAVAANPGIDAQFTPKFCALIEAIAETIIPATADSGGAKAAQIGTFMQEIVTLYYSPEEQTTFLDGVATINAGADTQFGRGFTELSHAQQESLLMSFETGETPESYRMFKQLTIWGYFSSEVGMTQARAFLPIPGRFEGDMPLEPGQKAWAY